LRTPLNAVLGFAQMLQIDPMKNLTANQLTHIDNILHGGNHLLKLVNDVLDLSAVEVGRIDLELEALNVDEVIRECLKMTSPSAETRGLVIQNKFEGRSAVYVQADRLRFKQALINIISNAIKFTNPHGTVCVDGLLIGENFRISVVDTGIGIAKADHEKIFQMFHRIGANSMITREGAGIGLAVTKLLMEQMSGKISFESEVGKGSTFWIELPLTRPPNY